MRPAGLREIEAAKADGRWEAAYAGQATATVPDDLQEALDAKESAAEAFAALDRLNRYAILHRIGAPGSAETRRRRIAKYITMLETGGKIYP